MTFGAKQGLVFMLSMQIYEALPDFAEHGQVDKLSVDSGRTFPLSADFPPNNQRFGPLGANAESGKQ
ncbi:hypothetical protein D1872_267690 [compost metagenome]